MVRLRMKTLIEFRPINTVLTNRDSSQSKIENMYQSILNCFFKVQEKLLRHALVVLLHQNGCLAAPFNKWLANSIG